MLLNSLHFHFLFCKTWVMKRPESQGWGKNSVQIMNTPAWSPAPTPGKQRVVPAPPLSTPCASLGSQVVSCVSHLALSFIIVCSWPWLACPASALVTVCWVLPLIPGHVRVDGPPGLRDRCCPSSIPIPHLLPVYVPGTWGDLCILLEPSCVSWKNHFPVICLFPFPRMQVCLQGHSRSDICFLSDQTLLW